MNYLRTVTYGIVIVLLLVVVACGSSRDTSVASQSGGGGEEASSRESSVPTMPAARFAQPTTMITRTQEVTATVVSEVSTPETDTARGAQLYEMRVCGDCHGVQAEGMADAGSALASTELTFAAFERAVRTGNSGDLGTEHVFGPGTISPSGLRAIYDWLVAVP